MTDADAALPALSETGQVLASASRRSLDVAARRGLESVTRHGTHGAAPRECVVCAAPLRSRFTTGPALRDAYPVCHSVECRMVVSNRAAMGEPAFRQYLQSQARLLRERKAHALRLQARSAAEANENATTWVAMEALASIGPSDRYLQLLLPSGPRRRMKLSQRRRKFYREHLLRIIGEAVSAAGPASLPVSSDAGGPDGTLAGHLCGMCGGGCCSRGGDTAYLSATTIRRFMAQQPQLQPAEILSAYLERLKTRTEAGSCINHTARGCGLPREMRADTCNNYACRSLAELQAAQQGSRPVAGVIAIRRRQDQWTRSKLLLDNDVTGLALITEAGISALSLQSRASAFDGRNGDVA